jgi:hypothetical protein
VESWLISNDDIYSLFMITEVITVCVAELVPAEEVLPEEGGTRRGDESGEVAEEREEERTS